MGPVRVISSWRRSHIGVFSKTSPHVGMPDAAGRPIRMGDNPIFLDTLLERLQSIYLHAIDGSLDPPITSISTKPAAAAR